ncbi:MAG: hypothetical protein KJ749_10775, partial [Planctomycetes bacterium]|nr:hypothetical protein [Planctomycetota bacterium]
MFRRLGFSGVVMVGVLSAAAYGDEDRPTVRIRDHEHAIWPLEDLIERGFEAQLIPPKDNAAWVYIEAINAYAEPPDELEDALEYAYDVGWPVGQDKLAEYLSQPANRAAMDTARRASRMERCQMPCFGDPSGSVFSILLP